MPDLAPQADPQQVLEATVDRQREEISQHLARVEQLGVSVRSLEDTVQRQAETLEQYKRSDENNLKAIETLEANVWEATDSKNQLLAQIGSLENQCEELKERLNASQDQVSANKAQLSLLESEIVSKTAELENLQALYNSCSDELAKLQSVHQDTGASSSETQEPSQAPESSPAVMHGFGTGEAASDLQQPSAFNFFQTPALDPAQNTAASFFQTQETSAASFFESLGSSNDQSQSSNNFFGGFQESQNDQGVSSAASFFNPQPASQSIVEPVQQTIEAPLPAQSFFAHQEPSVTTPAISQETVDSLQQELHQKISEFNDLSNQLETVKAELSEKQSEVKSLQEDNQHSMKNLSLQTETNSHYLQIKCKEAQIILLFPCCIIWNIFNNHLDCVDISMNLVFIEECGQKTEES